MPTLLLFALPGAVAFAQTAGSKSGREIYMERCFWCHGEEGRGDGPSAVGMFPRPRDLVRADYKIRSTHHGQLPTDEDLLDIVSTGIPGTPLPGWDGDQLGRFYFEARRERFDVLRPGNDGPLAPWC